MSSLRRFGMRGLLPLALAGCGGTDTPSQPANRVTPSIDAAEPKSAPPAPAPPRPDAAPAAANVLTAEGFGPLRIGMSRAEVVAALGEDSQPDAVGGADPETCDEFRPARGPEGMLVMIEAGRLTRISLTRNARTATDKGLRLGAPAATVRAAYGSALVVEPHKYVDAPAEYFTAWTADPPAPGTMAGPNARGIRYEVGADGKVQTIIAGGPSIQYVEGCA